MLWSPNNLLVNTSMTRHLGFRNTGRSCIQNCWDTVKRFGGPQQTVKKPSQGFYTDWQHAQDQFFSQPGGPSNLSPVSTLSHAIISPIWTWAGEGNYSCYKHIVGVPFCPPRWHALLKGAFSSLWTWWMRVRSQSLWILWGKYLHCGDRLAASHSHQMMPTHPPPLPVVFPVQCCPLSYPILAGVTRCSAWGHMDAHSMGWSWLCHSLPCGCG